ncbi:DUF1214 domain-containing protein [Parahaliea maris]|uniref:DUF1214 domain-containing protein n=1 Tax=Parahaliea maris TaxID=2716870 RepID=A0A5C9A311_9GAMM|nr:DUF1214 domain-containing protein [Parahaliea maris]TXS95263.1 DUF1214 domain-containing protein [Parahaliea maris]
MTASDSEERIMNGQAWADFCDGLKEAGQLVFADKAPATPFDRAEGYRYLSRMLRAGLESFVEGGDPAFPVLRCPAHETIKLGADNPDNHYQSAPLNPDYDYRLKGQRGTVDYLGFGTVINKYSSGGGMKTDGFLDSREMDIGEDGTFEVIISQREQPGNWLRMGPETNALNVRQTFQDRKREVRAELTLERVGWEEDRPAPLTPEKLDRGLQGTVQFVKNTTALFEGWAESFLPTTNQVAPADQDYCQAIGGDPNIYYCHSAWELADDEALVVEAAHIPVCQTWNFVLQNWWMESLDFRYFNIHFNKHTAHYEPDGSVKIIVAHQKPDHPNWVETTGHNRGTMCWRWIGAESHPPVSAKVVKFTEL